MMTKTMSFMVVHPADRVVVAVEARHTLMGMMP